MSWGWLNRWLVRVTVRHMRVGFVYCEWVNTWLMGNNTFGKQVNSIHCFPENTRSSLRVPLQKVGHFIYYKWIYNKNIPQGTKTLCTQVVIRFFFMYSINNCKSLKTHKWPASSGGLPFKEKVWCGSDPLAFMWSLLYNCPKEAMHVKALWFLLFFCFLFWHFSSLCNLIDSICPCYKALGLNWWHEKQSCLSKACSKVCVKLWHNTTD